MPYMGTTSTNSLSALSPSPCGRSMSEYFNFVWIVLFLSIWRWGWYPISCYIFFTASYCNGYKGGESF